MSRGAGTVMRAALAVLQEAGKSGGSVQLETIEITGRIYDTRAVSAAEHSSVRRALRRLYELGEIGESGRGRGGRRYWFAAQHFDALKARYITTFGHSGASMYKIKRPDSTVSP